MRITPPPAQFSGRFSEFYKLHVEPNLPAQDRVREFDRLLQQYLFDEDPVYVVRYVIGQTRGVISHTADGGRIRPTDNAPVWWTHAFLHSDAAFPKEKEALFEAMPSHFFTIARTQTLNQAGYHAAHIIDAKNRETGWRGWSRTELARRTLVNIHPCNMFLVAKQEWRRNGGRPDIIAWIVTAYLRRYGRTMERFLAESSPNLSYDIRPADPVYSYGWEGDKAAPTKSTPVAPKRISARAKTAHSLRTNRPMIWRDRVGHRISLEIAMNGSRYILQHDDLVAWVRQHTTALETASWTKEGMYSWPRTSIAMLQFLERYKVEEQ